MNVDRSEFTAVLRILFDFKSNLLTFVKGLVSV